MMKSWYMATNVRTPKSMLTSVGRLVNIVGVGERSVFSELHEAHKTFLACSSPSADARAIANDFGIVAADLRVAVERVEVEEDLQMELFGG